MKRRKTHQHKLKGREKKKIQIFRILFGVWSATCELSIYRENLKLICENLWKQVNQILFRE